MDFKTRLKKMQEAAKKQMEGYTPGGFQAIPDGDYTMRITATLDETKKAPARLQVAWCFTVAEGDNEGTQGWDRTILEDNKVGLQICRQRIEMLGYEWPEDDLASLQDIIEEITNQAPNASVRVKSKPDGEYTNTNYRILEVFGSNDQPAQTEEETTGEETVAEETVDEVAADDNQQALLDFCAAQGINGITSDMTVEEIVDGLKEGGITFKKEELSEEELALLEAIEAADLVEAPAKKTLAKKAPVAKAPLKKGKK